METLRFHTSYFHSPRPFLSLSVHYILSVKDLVPLRLLKCLHDLPGDLLWSLGVCFLRGSVPSFVVMYFITDVVNSFLILPSVHPSSPSSTQTLSSPTSSFTESVTGVGRDKVREQDRTSTKGFIVVFLFSFLFS